MVVPLELVLGDLEPLFEFRFDCLVDYFALDALCRVELLDFLCFVVLQFQPLFLHSLFVSQFGCQVLPLEFRQVLDSPSIVGIE